ncbi:S8 family serine peptidase [Pedobacter sp. Leaf176]|uniref:S8 family serine peptidase n=1 Tax=Pedobacter sp. Leaf176 TaxID=1736286 RepID=UPI000700D0B3|nr:S8 family serine peptidase [Pedobacter sp. Leaf176]KQR66971.1 hypothetical protein ASF92_19680 [Pedobacter sp. Leaf176]
MIQTGEIRAADERPLYTGRQLVMVEPGSKRISIAATAKKASINLASFNDYGAEDADFTMAFEDADGIVFEQLGIMVVNEEKQENVSSMLGTATFSESNYAEPERYVYALNSTSSEFMRGYKAAVDNLYGQTGFSDIMTNNALFADDATSSWGIQATDALHSKYTGKGIKLAILDTGFNSRHADFAGRTIVSNSFISGEDVMDGNGHGTHCAGISAGHINSLNGFRYGVASEANLFIAKVLSNSGAGTDSAILAGIEWAMMNKCKVISMSLGAPVVPGQPYSKVYNDIAVRANAAGTLIIAAAGNECRRDLNRINPVTHPANCLAIMAVGALDSKLNSANFSCGGLNPDGGKVDIAGPGVDIYSSWKATEHHKVISGTSMAAPFVAGFAALYFEAFPNASAAEIWMYLVQRSKPLNLNSSDVGAGLVQGPA